MLLRSLRSVEVTICLELKAWIFVKYFVARTFILSSIFGTPAIPLRVSTGVWLGRLKAILEAEFWRVQVFKGDFCDAY